MALPASPHRRGRSPATKTVAELIARAPRSRVSTPPGASARDLLAHREGHDPVTAVTEPISVAALLRREGRGPRIADRPLVPRLRDREPPQPPRHSGRKIAVVMCALFATSTILGSAGLQPVQRTILGCGCEEGDLSPSPDAPSHSARSATLAEDPPPAVMLASRAVALAPPSDAAAEPSGAAARSPAVSPSTAAHLKPASSAPRPRSRSSAPAQPPPGTTPVTSARSGATPQVTISPPAVRVTTSTTSVRLPQVSVSTGGTRGVRVETTPTKVQTPTVQVSAETGLVGLTGTAVELPDVTVGTVAVNIPAAREGRARIEIPMIEVSRPRVRLPDLTVAGQPVLRTPDITLPALRTPAVTLDHRGLTLSGGKLGR